MIELSTAKSGDIRVQCSASNDREKKITGSEHLSRSGGNKFLKRQFVLHLVDIVIYPTQASQYLLACFRVLTSAVGSTGHEDIPSPCPEDSLPRFRRLCTPFLTGSHMELDPVIERWPSLMPSQFRILAIGNLAVDTLDVLLRGTFRVLSEPCEMGNPRVSLWRCKGSKQALIG